MGGVKEKVIYKYPCELEDSFIIEMPKGAEILSVQVQHGHPFLWALVEPDVEKEERRFQLFGTGHIIHWGLLAKVKFIGTFQLSGGMIVFHLFETTNT